MDNKQECLYECWNTHWVMNSTEKAIMKFHCANTLCFLALDFDTLYFAQVSISGWVGRIHESQTRMPMDRLDYTLGHVNSTDKAIFKFHFANTFFSLALDSDSLY